MCARTSQRQYWLQVLKQVYSLLKLLVQLRASRYGAAAAATGGALRYFGIIDEFPTNGLLTHGT